jgi:hypothetical protein
VKLQLLPVQESGKTHTTEAKSQAFSSQEAVYKDNLVADILLDSRHASTVTLGNPA